MGIVVVDWNDRLFEGGSSIHFPFVISHFPFLIAV